jgi:hypothetical protein
MKLNDTAKRALDDLYFFCTEYWRLDLEEHPHRAMCDVIQKTEDDPSKPYAMLVVPRGTYKTSVGRAAVTWKQLRQIHLFDNLYHRIAISSAILAHGETSLRSIEGQLRTNRHLIEDFGELWLHDRNNNLSSRHPDGIVLAPRLRAGEIATVAEPNFWVGSILRVSTGFHADGALIDDLNNWDNVQTDDRREKIKDYWRLFFPILGRSDRGGRPSTIIMNATPWHDDDVRGMVLRRERERAEQDEAYESPYGVLQHSAYNDDGTAWWPTKLGLDVLEKLHEEMSERQFSANYRCDPVGVSGFVAEDQVVFKKRSEFPQNLRWFRATVDPNAHFSARNLGCYAAIMVSGYDQFANLYFYDARGSREWDTAALINELFELNATYPNIPILVEDVHMAHFDHAIRLEEANRGIHLRIDYVPTEGESKYQKWSRLQPRFRTNRVFFAEEIPIKLKIEIREELVRGQSSRFKDFLDAMAMSEIGIRPTVKAGTMQSKVQQLNAAIPNGAGNPTFANLIPDIGKFFQ